MTVLAKINFISSILNDARERIINKLGDVPESWDGTELRQYIVDYIDSHYNTSKMSKQRKKDYNNEVLIRNL